MPPHTCGRIRHRVFILFAVFIFAYSILTPPSANPASDDQFYCQVYEPTLLDSLNIQLNLIKVNCLKSNQLDKTPLIILDFGPAGACSNISLFGTQNVDSQTPQVF